MLTALMAAGVMLAGYAAAWVAYTLAVLFGNAARLAAKTRTRLEALAWNILYYLTVGAMLLCLLVGAVGTITVLWTLLA